MNLGQMYIEAIRTYSIKIPTKVGPLSARYTDMQKSAVRGGCEK
jgi:hypothetical protein